jgi:hypothetical protein
MACLQLGLWHKLLIVHQVAASHYMLIAACTLPAVTAVETSMLKPASGWWLWKRRFIDNVCGLHIHVEMIFL